MKTLLVVNSSGRVTRSITRHLTARFAARWRALHPHGAVLERETGTVAPPTVNEAWIAAAFAPASENVSPVLEFSERCIAELAAADVVAIGAPMYNFGLPAQLKAYFDQVVRVGRTFAFDPAASDPYRPLLADRPVVVITSAGDGAVHPGGPLAHMNHLEPHLRTLLGFIGLTDVRFVRAGFDEYQDERARRSLSRAEAEIDRVVEELAAVRLAV
ncbi:MAG TPA: NAD(P)H-dependent oxidoreductase [Opitutus sp.]|nr:NAD(P)H-dependent oxidoreductase [Opitutus sp.]